MELARQMTPVSLPSIIQRKCNEFVLTFNENRAVELPRRIMHNGVWKESEHQLAEVTNRILDTFLEMIADSEQGSRKKSARVLLDRYKLPRNWCWRTVDLLMPKVSGRSSTGPTGAQDPQIDRKKAKEWEEKRSRSQIRIHQPIKGDGNVLIGNVNNSRLSVVEPSSNKRNQEGVQGDKVPKRTKTIGKAENIDDNGTDSECNEADLNCDDDLDYDNDDVDYSNCDIDPNIELSEKRIPAQSHLKYPDKDSPDNIWKLPSGKSIDEIIRGPKNIHKSQKPEWIKQEDWDYLNSSVEYPHYNLSTEVEDLFSVLLETNSLNEYKNCLYNVTFDREKNIEMTFVTDVLLWFINKNEALLGTLMIHPVLQYFVNSTNRIIYVPGEIYLKASANQRLLRRNLKPDDDKPLGMKVDGSFQSPNDKGLEIGMVELSGGYLTKDTPRYLKDHVKGNWGCRDLLNEIITKYNHGDYKILRRLRVWFFHIHGLEVQIWGMDLPVAKTYRMFLIGAFYLPISWDNHYELVHALRVLQNLRRGLDDSLEVLEEFKKSHRRNTIMRFQSSTLKRYIGDAKSSPQKPTGKKSRIINPVDILALANCSMIKGEIKVLFTIHWDLDLMKRFYNVIIELLIS
ncbi:4449_t:CDS:10, partial [Diversispora eburnea]